MTTQFLTTESSLEKSEIERQSKFIIEDPVMLKFMQLMTDTITKDFNRRKKGLETDTHILSRMTVMDLDRISCPELIMLNIRQKQSEMPICSGQKRDPISGSGWENMRWKPSRKPLKGYITRGNTD